MPGDHFMSFVFDDKLIIFIDKFCLNFHNFKCICFASLKKNSKHSLKSFNFQARVYDLFDNPLNIFSFAHLTDTTGEGVHLITVLPHSYPNLCVYVQVLD